MTNLMDLLDMKYVHVNKDLVTIEMPVTEKVTQPMGYLHGGATVALAETAASLGGMQHVHPNEKAIVGLEINCNHIKAKKDGKIIAKAIPIHIGKRTMIWEIKVVDEVEQLIAIARCTLAVISTK
ncbi:PaaI family thioesterase [Gracilibacillus marinus]|jgi:1,4-dihydroxy-2-naphthoyl-CoA hydrolase|uniref:PaaI family thioesterase n=1 Tax=Gracilibacillus marinus TaxID=630535 RepID=A0ABV8VT40_9BACI